jgi:hypothetical protein
MKLLINRTSVCVGGACQCGTLGGQCPVDTLCVDSVDDYCECQDSGNIEKDRCLLNETCNTTTGECRCGASNDYCGWEPVLVILPSTYDWLWVGSCVHDTSSDQDECRCGPDNSTSITAYTCNLDGGTECRACLPNEECHDFDPDTPEEFACRCGSGGTQADADYCLGYQGCIYDSANCICGSLSTPEPCDASMSDGCNSGQCVCGSWSYECQGAQQCTGGDCTCSATVCGVDKANDCDGARCVCGTWSGECPGTQACDPLADGGVGDCKCGSTTCAENRSDSCSGTACICSGWIDSECLGTMTCTAGECRCSDDICRKGKSDTCDAGDNCICHNELSECTGSSICCPEGTTYAGYCRSSIGNCV